MYGCWSKISMHFYNDCVVDSLNALAKFKPTMASIDDAEGLFFFFAFRLYKPFMNIMYITCYI